MRKNKFFKILLATMILIVTFIAGHENPEIINNTKKLFLTFNNLDKKSAKQKTQKKEAVKFETVIDANSFKFRYENILSFEEKTASLIFEDTKADSYKIFTQSGFLIDKKKQKLNMPENFYTDQDGGIKSAFKIDDDYYVLFSQKEGNCFFASIIKLANKEKIIKSKCIPDSQNINFAGLGGAYIFKDDKLLISIGTPTHISDVIDLLSQNEDSIFGKIISFEIEDLKKKNQKVEYDYFSRGHRNPQGLVKYKTKIFSLEHGPQGGDELNEIVKNSNYGWPKSSLGTRYNDGKSFSRSHEKLGYKGPIYTFLPAVAPSALNKCPEELSGYYEGMICLIGLSLKEMSLFIFLLNENNSNLINIEKIKLDKRLRHFGLTPQGDLFVDDDGYFFFTSDTYGLFKGKFSDFR